MDLNLTVNPGNVIDILYQALPEAALATMTLTPPSSMTKSIIDSEEYPVVTKTTKANQPHINTRQHRAADRFHRYQQLSVPSRPRL
jgi:hypothetical protein